MCATSMLQWNWKIPTFTWPDFSKYASTFAEAAAKNIEWSALTRRRKADVVVGMTLHCVLTSLHVVLLLLARAALRLLMLGHSALWKAAAILGLVRPLRLVKDRAEVREQLKNATVLRVSNFNLVLFEGLNKEE